MEVKMKKNFFTGLFSGLCGSVLIFAIAGAVYLGVTGNANVNSRIEAQEKEQVGTNEIQYDEIVNKLSALGALVDKYYLEDVDENKYADGIYKGFMSSLGDPYSTYYTKEEYSSLMESSSGVYCGIGASVSQNAKTGIITIVKLFSSGPAYKAGILPGDIIYKVEGKNVTGIDLTEVVSRMKGKEGTKVKLTIVRENESEPLDYTIKRSKIEIPTIDYKMLDNKIGYIIIGEFDEITVSQFKKAVDKLEDNGMKGLVVDVRNNPGGRLDSVVTILDRLLPKGLIVYTEDKYGTREEKDAKDDKKLEVPLAVLINGQSASASEIFAGAIQDYKDGTIVGTTSFGKGIVQQVIPLTDGSAVKMTISKYYTPKGRNIHGTGIEPDVKVELDDKLKQKLVIPISEDNQLQKAIKIIKKKMK
jgi:carboxyl-terminal processing protease